MSAQETGPEVQPEPTPETPGTPPEPTEPEPTPETPETPEAPEEPAPPAEEPPAPQGLSDKERERQQTALDKEAKRHTARVAELLGDDAADAILCPLCDPQLQGFLYPAALEHPRDDVQARMIQVLLQPHEPEYLDAPHAHRCQDCDGFGVVKSGSRKPGNETVACPTCKALGYVTDPRFAQNGLAPAAESPQLVAVGATEPVIEDQDAWGSPRLLGDGQENPNYGRMPQYKNPNLP